MFDGHSAMHSAWLTLYVCLPTLMLLTVVCVLLSADSRTLQ